MKTGSKLLNWSQLLQYSFSGITTVSLQLRIDIKKSLEIIMSIIAGEVHWDCSWRVLWWESGRLYSQCRPRHGSRLIIYQLINSQWENFSSPCSIEITILVIIIFIIVIMISIMKTQFMFFFLQAGREELLLEMYSNMMDSMKAFWTHTLELLPIIQILPNTTRRLQSRLKLSRAQWHFFRLPSFRLIPFHIWSSFAKKNIVNQFDRMHKSVGNWTWFQFWFF